MKTIQLYIDAPENWEIDTEKLTPVFATYFDSPIKFYDDSWGNFWVFRDTGGIVGIVRARTWEDAYSIVEDEFLPVVPVEDIHECYDMTAEQYAKKSANNGEDWPDLVEGYSYQSNSTGSGIVHHDLNGESLDVLTLELIEHLEIKVGFTVKPN